MRSAPDAAIAAANRWTIEGGGIDARLCLAQAYIARERWPAAAAAFGPGVPDGVISLDAMALERGVAAPGPSLGLVTFEGGGPDRPVYRPAAALAAAMRTV